MVTSGPTLVSRIGDARCFERTLKDPKTSFIDPMKSIEWWRQQEDGHGSRNSLRKV